MRNGEWRLRNENLNPSLRPSLPKITRRDRQLAEMGREIYQSRDDHVDDFSLRLQRSLGLHECCAAGDSIVVLPNAGVNDQVGETSFIFQSDKGHSASRARPLTHEYDASDRDRLSVFELSQTIGGSNPSTFEFGA